MGSHRTLSTRRFVSRFSQGMTLINCLLVPVLIMSQLMLPPKAEAASPGTSTLSAGSAPTPAATLHDSFQPDLFTGRATTGVPINVPPGRRGLQPSLSLTYASSSQNGWLGVGWGLDLGFIERSTRYGVPRYDGSDTFAFTFQGVNTDLVRVADNVYRARDEGFFMHFENLGDEGWEVKDKSGTRHLFGRTSASRIDNGNQTFRWCLNKVIDANGNTMEVKYAKHDLQTYPASIAYTGHESGLAPACRVDFILESRPDVVSSYRGGFETKFSRRLAGIETYATVDGALQLALRYQLVYALSGRTGRSLLTTVTQIGSDRSSSFPPIKFSYQDSNMPSYIVNFTPGSGGQVAWNVRVAGYDCGHDNYGYVHPYYPPPCGPPSYGAPVVVSGSTTVGGRAVTVGSDGSINVSGAQDNQIHAWTSVYLDNAQTKTFSTAGGDVACMWVEDSTGIRGPFSFVSPSVSFNAGWSIIHIIGYNQNQGWSMGITSAVASMFDLMSPTTFTKPQLAGDVDGNGNSDLINFDNGTWNVSIAQRDTLAPPTTWLTGFGDSSYSPLLGDWNADGKIDVGLYKNGTWRFATSTGSSFQKDTIAQISFGNGVPLTGEFNGDGITDLGTYNEGQWKVALGTGNGFTATGSLDLFMSEGQPQLAPNDVRWHVRAASYDCGHDNYGCVPPGAGPPCGQPSYSERDLVGTATVGGAGWSVGGSGTINCNAGQDRHAWATVAVYTRDAETHSFSLSGGDVSCFYVQPQGQGASNYGWGGSIGGVSFPAGWSYIHIVGYNQNQGMSMGVSSSLISKFDIVSPNIIEENVSTATHLTGDFNGDGLTDIAIQDQGQLYVAYSDGTQFIRQSAWPVTFGSEEYTTADFNGDGLTDLAYFNRPTGKLQVGYSTGSGFSSPIDLPFTLSLRSSDDAIQLGELNGDGLPDPAIFNPLSGDSEMVFSVGTAPDLLVRVDNGVGGSTFISYQPTTTLANDFLPMVMQVVGESHASDGLGSTYSTKYNYAKGLYDFKTKEFRGFGRVEVRDSEGVTAVTEFHQDFYRKGRPYRNEVRDGVGNLWSKTEHTWSTVDPYPGFESYFTKLDQMDEFTYDGDATNKHVRFRYAYDKYGNQTAAYMDGELSVTGDERRTETTYAYNENAWVLNKPAQTKTLDAYGNIAAQIKFSYDDKWNLIKEERWLNFPDTIWIASRFGYNAYGNVVTITDALNRTTVNTYESTHTFVEQVVNPLGHTRHAVYDPRTGKIVSTTNPNAVTTVKAYDPVGREVSTGVIDPGTGSTIILNETVYDLASKPASVISTAYAKPNKGSPLTRYEFFDGMGRSLQSRMPAENPSKQIVTGAVEYDSKGRVIKRWLPYLDSVSASYVPHNQIQGIPPPVQFSYDPLNRVTSTTNPDSSTAYTDYDDWVVTSIDENGHTIRQTSDAYGRVIQVEEVNGGESYITVYEYDSLDNLTKLTDTNGNVTNINYDSFSRKISMDDPDMGTWSYQYDAVGNLKIQTDARGVVINFSYDDFNRLLRKDYTIPGGSALVPQQPVVYEYDAPNVPFSKGKLTSLSDESGTAKYAYDFLDRLTSETRTIDNTIYTIQRSYDLLGRMNSMTYPNGDVVSYAYNNQNAIEAISLNSPTLGEKSIITNMDYNATGQMTKIQYGNGVVTNFTYDPQMLRINKLVSNNPEKKIQDFSYQFDPVGNLLNISDSVNTATQVFNYDDLNRLIQANGNYGNLTYAYDPVGNIIRKADVQMIYGQDSAGPHAVTSTDDGTTMTYDENGNLISKRYSGTNRTPQKFTYDAENRLTQVTVPFYIKLNSGWNFLSFPHIKEEVSILQQLPDFGSAYEQLTRLNEQTGKFESFVNKPGIDQFNTLEPQRGYWLYVENQEEAILKYDGAPHSPYPLQLGAGWQILPGPVQSMAVSDWLVGLQAGVDYKTVIGYKTSTDSLGPMHQVEPGRAYYVEILRSVSWTPPVPPQSHLLSTVKFIYDGEGGRVKKITPYGETIYLGKAFEVSPYGVTTEYIFAGSQRIATITSKGSLRYYHGDHLRSSNVITDAAGQVVESIEYKPYGSTSYREGSISVSHKFTDQEQDEETGLYNYNARFYDPAFGVFISPDSIVPDPYGPQTLNRYSYCVNNPLIYTDPDGHDFGLSAIIVGAVIGAFSAGAQSDWDVGAMLQGAAIGGISGAFFAGASAVSDAMWSSVWALGPPTHGAFIAGNMMSAGIYTAAGAMSGGVNASLFGGDVGVGMLTGGIAGGVAGYFGTPEFITWENDTIWGATMDYIANNAITGGIAGAAYSGMTGGNIVEGAISGAKAWMLHAGAMMTVGHVVGITGAAFSGESLKPVPYKGQLVYEGNSFGSITLGNVVFGQKNYFAINGLPQHEKAHTLQNTLAGPGFYSSYLAQLPVALFNRNPFGWNFWEHNILFGAPASWSPKKIW